MTVHSEELLFPVPGTIHSHDGGPAMLTKQDQPALKLSICITTFNRAAFIGETLESILGQLTDECEVVVLDGASPDDTKTVVSGYARQCSRLRYIRQETNNGVDQDYDRVVNLARGEYCWLMTDDDLLKPDAVAVVLGALRRNWSLVIVNVEMRDLRISRVLQPRTINLTSDQVYGAGEMDRLFVELRDVLTYIGGVVIRRSIWLERERERYYGSWFIFVGVIFQERLPGDVLVIAKPLICYRMGNTHTFSPKLFETLMVKWPALVWSLSLSDSVKRSICSSEPWRSFHELLFWRAWGFYSMSEYRRLVRPRLSSILDRIVPRLVALLPGVLANMLMLFYYSLAGGIFRGVWKRDVALELLRGSRFHVSNWGMLKHQRSGS